MPSETWTPRPDDLIEEGVVTAVEERMATVCVARGAACGHQCDGGCLCGLEAAQATVLVRAHNHVAARQGDKVRLAMRPGRLLGLAALAYGLPILTLFLGAILGPTIAAAFGAPAPGDGTRAVAALVGLGFGLVALKVMFRRVRPDGGFVPVVVEIVR